MIYTLTFNPALDQYIYIDDLHPGTLTRAKEEYTTFGGKGLNVSCVLSRLGVENRALGFLAGKTGDIIESLLTEAGVTHDLIRLKSGQSRLCVKIRAREETDIHGIGPEIPQGALDALTQKLSAARDGDTLIIAGSLPASLPDDSYERLLHRLRGKELRIVADTTGERLRALLPYHPFLIKPNHHELAELTGTPVDSPDSAYRASHSLQSAGARNVLVSMGGAGALLVCEDGSAYTASNASVPVRDTVGAGDSMVAGFLAGLELQTELPHALRMGAATANATCMVRGLAAKADALRLCEQIKVEKL